MVSIEYTDLEGWLRCVKCRDEEDGEIIREDGEIILNLQKPAQREFLK